MILSEAWRALLLVLCLGWLPSSTALADDVLIPVTRFDSKGQLPQSNAAAQAVERGGAVVAIVGRSEILFVAPRCVWFLNTVACVRCVSRSFKCMGRRRRFTTSTVAKGHFSGFALILLLWLSTEQSQAPASGRCLGFPKDVEAGSDLVPKPCRAQPGQPCAGLVGARGGPQPPGQVCCM